MSAKDKLHNGCVVESKNGIRRIFISQFGIGKEDVFMSDCGFLRAKDYNDHLVFTKDESNNIVSIYNYPAGYGLDGIYRKDLTKIWDVDRIELSISEIAMMLGYPADKIAIVK